MKTQLQLQFPHLSTDSKEGTRVASSTGLGEGVGVGDGVFDDEEELDDEEEEEEEDGGLGIISVGSGDGVLGIGKGDGVLRRGTFLGGGGRWRQTGRGRGTQIGLRGGGKHG